jgi:tetratricopeptide (TPR) repeat protein
LLDGEIQTITTDEEVVSITWKPNTDADPLQKVADILQEGKYADGITLLELFLSDDPTNTTVLFNLGVGLMQMERHAEALEHLRSAVELKADNPAAWFEYGQTLQLNGDTQEAHKAYRKVIDMDESGEIAERARTALKEK